MLPLSFVVLLLSSFFSLLPLPTVLSKPTTTASVKPKLYRSHLPTNDQHLLSEAFFFLCTRRPSTMEQGEWMEILSQGILEQLDRAGESAGDKYLKRLLTERILSSSLASCSSSSNDVEQLFHDESPVPRETQRQSPPDGRISAGMGVENVLSNVFSGNIFGIIQSSAGVKSPEQVSTRVADIFRTMLNNISSMRKSVSNRLGFNSAKRQDTQAYTNTTAAIITN